MVSTARISQTYQGCEGGFVVFVFFCHETSRALLRTHYVRKFLYFSLVLGSKLPFLLKYCN